MTSDIVTFPLMAIEDERGAVLHMLRADSPVFTRFGEIYFSQVNPGVVKGWKRHQKMTQRFAVPFGRIKLVVYDDRDSSRDRAKITEYLLGRPDSYQLIVLPPLVWYAFQGVAETVSIIANCSDIPHDPGESEQLPLDTKSIAYSW